MVSISSTIISILLAELILRFYLFGMHGFYPSSMASYSSKRWSESIQMAKDTRVFYELRPGCDHQFKFHPFKTNQNGLRDREYGFNKPNATRRMAIIGDSFTMGWGVEQDQIYHEVMEKQLNERSDTINYELINFGVAGYNLTNYLGTIKTKVINYSPDYILIGFCAKNDLKTDEEIRRNSERMMNRDQNGYFTLFLKQLIKTKIKILKKMYATRSLDQERERFIRKRFNQIAEIAERSKIPVIVAYLSIVHEEIDHSRETVEKIAQESGMFFVDASVSFKNSNVREYAMNLLDSHPNKLAHDAFANSILESSEFRLALD